MSVGEMEEWWGDSEWFLVESRNKKLTLIAKEGSHLIGEGDVRERRGRTEGKVTEMRGVVNNWRGRCAGKVKEM